MTDVRLEQVCADARDCLTRAAALYAIGHRQADWPATTGEKVRAPGSPESRPPSVGDAELRATMRRCAAAIGRCVDHLAGIVTPYLRPHTPLTPDADSNTVTAHVQYAANVLDYVAKRADRLSDKAHRDARDAAADARAALWVWDTPPTTLKMRMAFTDLRHARDEGNPHQIIHAENAVAKAEWEARKEHGTAVEPPAHYYRGPRCKTCGWAKPEEGRRECSNCRTQRTGRRSA